MDQQFLFLFFLLVRSDVIACALLARKHWLARDFATKRLAFYLSLMLWGWAIRGTSEFIAHAFGFSAPPTYNIPGSISFWAGQMIGSAGTWLYYWYVTGNHHAEKADKEAR